MSPAVPSSGPGKSDDPLRGIAYILATMTALSASDAAAKWLVPHYAVAEIMFVRSLLALAPAALLTALTQGRSGFRTRRAGAHLARTLLMLLAWGAFIFALRELPLADAFTIAFAAPLFMTLFGFLFLRETIHRRRLVAVAVGFVGVLVVLQPGGAGDQGWGLPAAAALFAAVAYALSTIVSRRIAPYEASETLLFFYMLISTLVLALGLPSYELAIQRDHWPVFGISALCGILGHFLIARAFRYGEVSLLAPFEYVSLIWALLFGYWIFGDIPNRVVIAGAALIVASGIVIARLEGRDSEAGAEPDALG